MQITQIGSLQINATTGIEVTAVSQDHAGVGYDVRSLWRPRELIITLRIVRAIRDEALRVVDQLATDIYHNEKKRVSSYGMQSGIPLVCDARTGWSLYTRLGNVSMRLERVEQAANGVCAVVTLRGLMLRPPLMSESQAQTTTLTAVHAWRLTPVTLVIAAPNVLHKHRLVVTTPQATAMKDSIIIVESRNSASDVAQTRHISPTSASDNCVAQSLPGGGQRYMVQSDTTATVTYTIAANALPSVPLMMYVCVDTPLASSPLLQVEWPGQPLMRHILSHTRTWYPITVYDFGSDAQSVYLTLHNIATPTYIYPLLFVPIDGAYVWYVHNASTYNPLVLDHADAHNNHFRVVNDPNAVIYGPSQWETQRWLTIMHGIALPTMSDAISNITIISRLTVPSAWM